MERNAGRNIGIEAYEVAAFLASQAVEKCLKGAWIEVRGEAPPWTHSLTELGDALGVPPGLVIVAAIRASRERDRASA